MHLLHIRKDMDVDRWALPPIGIKEKTVNSLEFRKALEAFARIDGAMPLSAVQTLVWVGLNDGSHQSSLEQYLGASGATASRSIQWWSDWRSFKEQKRGPGFIESYPDPLDKRYRVVRITPKGHAFLTAIYAEANDGKATR